MSYTIEITKDTNIFWTKNSVDKPCKTLFDLIVNNATWETGNGLSINWINQFNAQIVVDSPDYTYIRVTNDSLEDGHIMKVQYYLVDNINKNLSNGGYVLDITQDVFSNYVYDVLTNDNLKMLSIVWERGNSFSYYIGSAACTQNMEDDFIVWEECPLGIITTFNNLNTDYISYGAMGRILMGCVASVCDEERGSNTWLDISGLTIGYTNKYYNCGQSLCPVMWVLQLSNGTRYGLMQFGSNPATQSNDNSVVFGLPLTISCSDSSYSVDWPETFINEENFLNIVNNEIAKGAVFVGKFPFPFFWSIVDYIGNMDLKSDFALESEFEGDFEFFYLRNPNGADGGTYSGYGIIGLMWKREVFPFVLNEDFHKYNIVFVKGSGKHFSFVNNLGLSTLPNSPQSLHPYFLMNLKIPNTKRIRFFYPDTTSGDISYYYPKDMCGLNDDYVKKGISLCYITFSDLTINFFTNLNMFKDSMFQIGTLPNTYDSYSDYVKSVKSQQNASLLSGFNNLVSGTIGRSIPFGMEGVGFGLVQGISQFANTAFNILGKNADAKRSAVAINQTSDYNDVKINGVWTTIYSNNECSNIPYPLYFNALPVYFPVDEYQAQNLIQRVLWGGFFYNNSTNLGDVMTKYNKWLSSANITEIKQLSSGYLFFVLKISYSDISFLKMEYPNLNEELLSMIQDCMNNLIRLWSCIPLWNETYGLINICDWTF